MSRSGNDIVLIERLEADNAELRAEVAKWKSEYENLEAELLTCRAGVERLRGVLDRALEEWETDKQDLARLRDPEHVAEVIREKLPELQNLLVAAYNGWESKSGPRFDLAARELAEAIVKANQ